MSMVWLKIKSRLCWNKNTPTTWCRVLINLHLSQRSKFIVLKKCWWANFVPANFMLSQDCLTMPDLPQLVNLLQIGCEPSHSPFLLCFCLLAHRVIVLGSSLASFICRHRALYFLLSVVSICSHGSSCGPAMHCVSTLPQTLPLPRNWMLATTPWLSSQRQGQDLSQIKAMCASFVLSQIPLCLSQARMKVGRSKTAARALGEDSPTGLLLPAHAKVLYAALWLCIEFILSLQDHSMALSPALLFNC